MRNTKWQVSPKFEFVSLVVDSKVVKKCKIENILPFNNIAHCRGEGHPRSNPKCITPMYSLCPQFSPMRNPIKGK